MRLLPRDPHIGWAPYAWLVYLGLFLSVPAAMHAGAAAWAATIAAAAVFLVLYFVGYWVSGTRLLLVTVAVFALGAGFAPWNPNASVFCVYAAAFAARFSPPRRALQALGAILAATAAESLALSLGWEFWLPAIVFSLMIGGICMQQAERRRAADLLAASQAEVQQLVRIAERERIARDLHDLLGHTLLLIAVKAELAGKLLAISPERAAAEIRDVESVTREALREVRAAIGGYRSEGLPAELARARLALEAAGIRPEYFIVPASLAAAAEAALALAVREGVTNVIRHAGAAVCHITLERRGDDVVLEIADDGRGSTGVAAAPGGGMGLRVMRERLGGLGGRVEILSAEAPPAAAGKKGMRLRITLPQPGGAPAPAPPEPPAAAAGPASAQGPALAGGAVAALAVEPGR